MPGSMRLQTAYYRQARAYGLQALADLDRRRARCPTAIS